MTTQGTSHNDRTEPRIGARGFALIALLGVLLPLAPGAMAAEPPAPGTGERPPANAASDGTSRPPNVDPKAPAGQQKGETQQDKCRWTCANPECGCTSGTDESGAPVTLDVVDPARGELTRAPKEAFTITARLDYAGGRNIYVEMQLNRRKDHHDRLSAGDPPHGARPDEEDSRRKILTFRGQAPQRPGTYWVHLLAGSLMNQCCIGKAYAGAVVKLNVVAPTSDKPAGSENAEGPASQPQNPTGGQMTPQGDPGGQGAEAGEGIKPGPRRTRRVSQGPGPEDPRKRADGEDAAMADGPTPAALRGLIQSLEGTNQGVAIHVPASSASQSAASATSIVTIIQDPKPQQTMTGSVAVPVPKVEAGPIGRPAAPPASMEPAAGPTAGMGAAWPPTRSSGLATVRPGTASSVDTGPRGMPVTMPSMGGLQPTPPEVRIPSSVGTIRPRLVIPAGPRDTAPGPAPAGRGVLVPAPGSQNLRSTTPPALRLTPPGPTGQGTPGVGPVPGSPALRLGGDGMVTPAPARPAGRGRAPAGAGALDPRELPVQPQ